MSTWPPNVQPFADGLAAHGFRLSRGTYHNSDEISPLWNIDRIDDPTFLPVFDLADSGNDEACIVGLIAEAFIKREAST